MSEHNLNFMPSEGFRARAKDVVENPFLRQSFRGAMDFLIGKRAAQFPEDAGPMAHPIRPSSFVEINNFYTSTVYEKGAEVIRMLKVLIGNEAFKAGMDLYFERCDGTAASARSIASRRSSGRISIAITPDRSAEIHQRTCHKDAKRRRLLLAFVRFFRRTTTELCTPSELGSCA